nr:hypothetical protein [uncultured Albidiferax sp.]
MFNSETLEVAIGMAFLFLLMALICTGIKEWLEGIFKWRAMDLERGLRTMLDDEKGQLTAYLYEHPLVLSLYQGKYDPAHLTENRLTNWIPGVSQAMQVRWSRRRNLPSYIPAGHFAKALIDLVGRGPASVDNETAPDALLTIAHLRERAAALSSPFLRRAVLSAIDHAGGDLRQLTENLQHWFDGSMDRASGWYKRRTQTVLFLLGIAAAIVLNVDALYIMSRLTADKTFRETVVSAAAKVEAPAPGAAGSPTDALETARKARAELDKVGMPVGWLEVLDNKQAWFYGLAPVQRCHVVSVTAVEPVRCTETKYSPLRIVLGWLITAFAVMLGAPFWFDLLNKFMVIRSTVKPHEKSREEGSEDRADTASKDAQAPSAPALLRVVAPAAGANAAGARLVPGPLPEAFVPHEWRDSVVNSREIPL